MVHVDDLLGDRSGLRQHAEPAERVDPFMSLQHTVRDVTAAHAAKTVAARDEVANDLTVFTILLVP